MSQAARRGEEGALPPRWFERNRRTARNGMPPKAFVGAPTRGRGACLPPSLSASLSVNANAFDMAAGA